MQKTVVIDTVALNKELLSKMPHLSSFAKKGAIATISPTIPAVTCSIQSTYLTGKSPNKHGIVANGWYFKDEAEIKFWHQSNKLVQAEKIWEKAKKHHKNFTCANLFWWYNIYSTVDYSITPRPMYPADGRKIPDVYTKPSSLRNDIQKELGTFPLFSFWGPATSIKASKWIADSALFVDKKYDPTLTLIYLPHLDYCLQKFGPKSEETRSDLVEIDKVCKGLIDYYRSQNTRIIVLSEYNIMPVKLPIHINRILRKNGLLKIREELGRELLDPGASTAFAVSDHQIAHVYINDHKFTKAITNLLRNTKGISAVLDQKGKEKYHLNHPRSGDLIVLADKNSWFTYYYWNNDSKAPDFARTVDIHRKPGFDPTELFIDSNLKFPKLKIAYTLFKKTLGFRTLLEVTPLNASLVRGSHGIETQDDNKKPVFITQTKKLLDKNRIRATDVMDLILNHLLIEN